MGKAVRSIAAASALLVFVACEDTATSVKGPTVGEIVGYIEAYDTTIATVANTVDTTEHRHPLANVRVLVYTEQAPAFRYEARTGADGFFVVPGLNVGSTYRIALTVGIGGLPFTAYGHPGADFGNTDDVYVVHGTADEYTLMMSDSPLGAVEVGDKTLGHDTGVGFIKFRARVCPPGSGERRCL